MAPLVGPKAPHPADFNKVLVEPIANGATDICGLPGIGTLQEGLPAPTTQGQMCKLIATASGVRSPFDSHTHHRGRLWCEGGMPLL